MNPKEDLKLFSTKPGFFFVLLMSLLMPLNSANAEIIADWGTISTPLEEDVTFTIAQYDVSSNFTHDYNFSLEGDADAFYEVTFNFDYCTRGCGNIATSYGIYEQNGSLISDVTTGGNLVLSTGNYSLQVKGTGFGAGNNLDYLGSMTFSATTAPTTAMISAAPEPESFLLMLTGLLTIGIFRIRQFFWKQPNVGKIPLPSPS